MKKKKRSLTLTNPSNGFRMNLTQPKVQLTQPKGFNPFKVARKTKKK